MVFFNLPFPKPAARLLSTLAESCDLISIEAATMKKLYHLSWAFVKDG
jgi:hypothetical protein